MRTIRNILLVISLPMIMTSLGHAQTTSAPSQPDTKTQAVVPAQGTFTDANGNGICDNREAGTRNYRGRHFVDKNGDGICDNRDNQRRGPGGHHGMRGYRHHGQGYCQGRGMAGCNRQGNHHRHGAPVQGADPVKEPQK